MLHFSGRDEHVVATGLNVGCFVAGVGPMVPSLSWHPFSLAGDRIGETAGQPLWFLGWCVCRQADVQQCCV